MFLLKLRVKKDFKNSDFLGSTSSIVGPGVETWSGVESVFSCILPSNLCLIKTTAVLFFTYRSTNEPSHGKTNNLHM